MRLTLKRTMPLKTETEPSARYYGIRYIPCFEILLILPNQFFLLNQRSWKMSEPEVESCCELGVKGSCVTCEFSPFCKGKWKHATSQDASAEAELVT